ncbi:MAG: hypothetical protein Q8P20_10535 [bacterium]|nr:hypothetical protein [bacterium]
MTEKEIQTIRMLLQSLYGVPEDTFTALEISAIIEDRGIIFHDPSAGAKENEHLEVEVFGDDWGINAPVDLHEGEEPYVKITAQPIGEFNSPIGDDFNWE